MLPWLAHEVARRTREADPAVPGPRPAVLHLFAYTGLATLATVAAGARVTHVDASRPAVGWARRNATRSGLAERAGPLDRRRRGRLHRARDPARSALCRGHPRPAELRARARRERLAAGATTCRPLLDACAEVLEPDGFMLLTAHTAGVRRRPPRARPRRRDSAGRRRRSTRATWRSRRADGRGPRAGRLRAVGRAGMMTSMRSPTPPVLTSASNPRVKAALALRERRERERSGLTLVDGARELRRALDAGVEVVEAFVCEPLLAGPDARAALDRLRARHGTGPRHERGRLRQARVRRTGRGPGRGRPDRRRRRSTRSTFRPTRWSSSSRRVEKPGNLGAVLRSADGAGVDAVVAASPRTDLFNPNAIRASAGTVFTRTARRGADGRGPRLAPASRRPDRGCPGRRRRGSTPRPT